MKNGDFQTVKMLQALPLHSAYSQNSDTHTSIHSPRQVVTQNL
jgi:hypothetical protein